jgi:phage-related minor tail protein
MAVTNGDDIAALLGNLGTGIGNLLSNMLNGVVTFILVLVIVGGVGRIFGAVAESIAGAVHFRA